MHVKVYKLFPKGGMNMRKKDCNQMKLVIGSDVRNVMQ